MKKKISKCKDEKSPILDLSKTEVYTLCLCVFVCAYTFIPPIPSVDVPCRTVLVKMNHSMFTSCD